MSCNPLLTKLHLKPCVHWLDITDGTSAWFSIKPKILYPSAFHSTPPTHEILFLDFQGVPGFSPEDFQRGSRQVFAAGGSRFSFLAGGDLPDPHILSAPLK